MKALKNNYLLIAASLLILIPFIANSQYIYHIAIMCSIYGLLAIGLNLITGFTGQLSLGQVAFYAIGAYGSTLLSMKLGVPVFLSMLLGGFLSAFFGFVVGFPALRLSGVYLGIATLGFAEIVRQVILIWVKLTRGPMGIPRVPKPNLFGFVFDSGIKYYVLILIILFVVYIGVDRLTKSRVGVVLLAIREDETAAESMGVNISFYKILTFIISAFISGIAGAYFSHFITFIGPTNFTSAESFLVLSMYVLGGPASLIGSVGGSIVLTIASEGLRFVQEFRQIFYALLLIVVILFKPTGISGMLKINKITAGMPKKESELVLEKYKTEG